MLGYLGSDVFFRVSNVSTEGVLSLEPKRLEQKWLAVRVLEGLG